MNFNKAIKILKIKHNFSNDELKKAYRKQSLKYHPDKNKSGNDTFIEVNEAYLYLSEYNNNNIDFTEYLRYVMDIDYDTFLTIENIIQKTYHKTIQLLSKYTYSHKIIEITPNIDNLFKNDIHIINENDIDYFIPTWHNELVFESFTVKIKPKLSENIYIDHDNNIHVSIEKHISDLLDNNIIEIHIGERTFEINTELLYIKKKQIYTLEKQGISMISENNIFETINKSDILIHITLLL